MLNLGYQVAVAVYRTLCFRDADLKICPKGFAQVVHDSEMACLRKRDSVFAARVEVSGFCK